MSKTVDERVVEMRFDNSNFEKNVQTSMSTLDKLKQSLNLEKSAKGLESINNAAKNTNISALGTAVETVQAKFSALEVIGVTALANITNQAVNAGKRIVSALTIEPITTGFQEYELKMDSVQTIMASTGESLGTVMDYLEELNVYADKTIYSFSDMTSNIGKFTNAGVKLEDAVNAIKGISNEAAVSGANANEASRAMYNFAQALSAGYVKLIDWKSIENANMATMEFKQQLIDTAVELGTVTKQGEKYVTVTTDANGKVSDAFTATSMFNESLSNQWMTTQVLTETLKKYSDETTDIGKKAYAAAQDIKTVSQMWDTIKEAAQSGWGTTWELVVGDMNEAKISLTDVANAISNIIDKSSKARNALVKAAFAGPWKKLTGYVQDAGGSIDEFQNEVIEVAKENGIAVDDLITQYGSFEQSLSSGWLTSDILIKTLEKFSSSATDVSSATEDMTAKIEDFQSTVKKIWDGDFGSAEERIQALTDAGYDYAEVQDLVTETLNGQQLTIADLSSEQLKNIGCTEDQIASLVGLAEQAKKTGTPLNELIQDMSKPSGRELLFDAITNTIENLGKVLNSIKEAWDETLGTMLNADLIYDIIKAFDDFTADSESVEYVCGNIKSAFSGLFNSIKLVATFSSGALGFLSKVVAVLKSSLGLDFWGLIGRAGDMATEFYNWIMSNNELVSSFKESGEIILDWIENIVTGFKNLITELFQFSSFKDLVLGFTKGLVESFLKIPGAFNNIVHFIESTVDNLVTLFQDGNLTVSDVLKAIGDVAKNFADNFADVFSGPIDAVKTFFNSFSDGVSTFVSNHPVLSKISEVFKESFGGIGETLGNIWTQISGFFKGLGSAIATFVTEGKFDPSFIVDIFNNLVDGLKKVIPSLSKVIDDIKTALTNFVNGIGEKFNLVKEGGKNLVDTITDTAKNIKDSLFKNFDFSDVVQILVGAGTLFGMYTVFKVFNDILGKFTSIKDSFTGMMKSISSAFKNVSDAKVIETKAKAFRTFAEGILMLAAALVALSFIDTEKLLIVAGVLLALTVAIGAVTFALSKLDPVDTGKLILMAGSVLAICAAMIIMAGALKLLSTLSLESVPTVLAYLAIIITSLLGLIAAFTWLENANGDAIKSAGKTILKISVSMLIMAIALKQISSISLGDLVKAEAVLVTLTGAITLMVLLMGIIGRSPVDGASSFMKIAASLLVLVLCVKLLGDMDPSKVVIGLTALSCLLIAVTYLVIINKIAGVQGASASMLAISASLLILVGVCLIMGKLDISAVTKGLACILLLGTAIAIVARIATKSTDLDGPGIKTLIGLSVAIGILAGVCVLLGLIDEDGLRKGITCIGVLSLFLAGLMKMSQYVPSAKDTVGFKSLYAMVYAIVALAVAVVALSMIDQERLVRATACIGLLMGMFSVMMVASKYAGKAYGTMGMMVGVIVVLAVVISIIGNMELDSAIEAAVSISVLMLSMSASMVLMSKLGSSLTKSWKSIALMLGVIGALAGLIYLIGSMDVGSAITASAAISILLLSMSASIFILSNMKGDVNDSLVSILVMVPVIVALAAIVAKLGGMQMDSAITAVTAISILLVSMSACMLLLNTMGSGASMGAMLKGIAGIDIFIAAITAIVAAIGEIDKLLDGGLLDSVSRAVPIFEQVGSAFGSLIGGFVSGISTSIFDSLPGIGENIAQFMDTIKIAFSGLDSIDTERLSTIGQLLGSMAVFEGVDSIISWFTGDSQFDKFGEQLTSFGEAIISFSDTVSSGSINQEAVQAAANAGSVLAALNKEIPNNTGIIPYIVGMGDLSVFGDQLVEFGAAIVKFSRIVSQEGAINQEAVQAAANAGAVMAALNKDIPNNTGIIPTLVGMSDLEIFGDQLVKFGAAIVKFSRIVSQEGAIDQGAIEAAANAGQIMAALQDNVDPNGGFVQWITGNTDLGNFGTQMANYGAGIKAFSDSVVGIDAAALGQAVSIGVSMNDLLKALPEQKMFDGKMNITEFGQKLMSFGNYYKNFSSVVSGVDSGKITSSISSIRAIVDVAKSMVGVDFSGIDKLSELGSVGDAIATYASKVASIDVDKVNTSVSTLQNLMSLISNMAGLDTSGIGSFKQAIKDLSSINVSSITASFQGASSKMSGIGVNFINAISSGMKKASPTLKATLSSVISSLATSVQSKTATMKTAGSNLAKSLIDGFKSKSSTFKSEVSRSCQTAASGASGARSSFYSAGVYMCAGLANGINSSSFLVISAATAVAKAAASAAKAALKIASPSKVFYQIGVYAGMGMVNALNDYSEKTYNAGYDVGDSAAEGLNRAVKRMGVDYFEGIDLNPKITPVLDLSDVKNGANTIDRMLSGITPMTAIGDISAISSSMARTNQNGSASDIVDELKALRKELGNVSGDSYMIGDVRYDDDSTVSNAVRDLIHATKVESRV